MSAQKKAKKVCKKRKEKSAQTKLLPLMASSSSCTQDQPAASDQESAHSTAPSERVLKLAAQRGANSRFRKKLLQSLPSGASERAEVLAAGIESLSPATKKAVNPRLGILSPNAKCKLNFSRSITSSFQELLSGLAKHCSVKGLRLKVK